MIDSEGKQIGVVDFEFAKEKAEKEGKDLILLNEKADPPVVRIGDYNAFIYQKEKKQRRLQKKQKETKEIRIGFNEAVFDLQRKAKIIKEFLEEGHQVQIKLMLKGRERNFLDLAEAKINKFLELIDISYKITSPLKQFPNFFTIIVSKK